MRSFAGSFPSCPTLPLGLALLLIPLLAREAPGSGHTTDRPLTRLFLTPTATPLGPGEFHLSLHELFFPALGIGVTDRVSIEAGFSLLPGASDRAIFLSPKVTPLRVEGLDVAFGLLYAKNTGAGGHGIGYVSMTSPGEGSCISLGAGWALGGDHAPSRPLLMGGVGLRFTRESDIMFDIVIPPNMDPALTTVGARFHDGGISVEIAVIIPWGSGGAGLTPLPWVSATLYP